MIISLAGHQGSGKSTVGKMLAEKLGYRQYSTGGFQRELARQRGLTLLEHGRANETDGGATDRLVDDWQRELGFSEDDFIIDGRLAFHFIPRSFKILFTVETRIGVERVMGDSANATRAGVDTHESFEVAVRAAEERCASESKRYMEYYGVDHLDPAHFDFVIDTTHLAPQEVFERVFAAFEEYRSRSNA